MNTLNIGALGESNKIHFIGIGGVSMSGLALIMLNRGCKVSGSDVKSSGITDVLQAKGAEIKIGHSADNVPDCDFVVYTAAIKKDNCEMVRAEELNIPLIERSTFLGAIMKEYSKAIAVAGTHGKTTTTSMLSYCMVKGNTDPTITVGGELDLLGGNLRLGGSEYFLAEACEYSQSFLEFFPYISVITNIEEDHLDCYRDLDHIKDTFREFALLTPADGAIVACFDDCNVRDVLEGIDRKIISYGLSDATWTARNITYNANGQPSFDVYLEDECYASLSLQVIGVHNILNALASVAVSHRLGIEKSAVLEGIEAFRGTKRRFEYKGKLNGAMVYDDYAHHPTEIEATLKAVSRTKHNTIHCVFQPHTYTRTLAFLDDFAKVFTGPFQVIITDIYAAREKDNGLVHAKDLADKIPGALYIKDFPDIEEHLKEKVSEGDLLITIGAGNVFEIGEHLVK